ncbi:hypothetical protein BU23DRAFT_452806 [Bimuria novae-zelandiae CBS 107.79]|uniref:Zn(2)-C6 fungal-type domain-containing protein n=1 Tax=Bimuria novae-zelandiae CBS 107.79 TaxID=1447943 RepID=A0A6A5VK54_9PLEO|nr:hypothetical protein BU23DRAFT_452806 [Bimuria novae-zelandiae CBS 107.79]
MATPLSKRKSCTECVKAKRKCGMELPKCTRCTKKNIICAYPSKSMASEIPIPELEFPWLDDLLRDPNALPWEGSLQPQLDAASASYSGSSESDIQLLPQVDFPELFVPKSSRSTLALPETEAALHRFKTWPEKWVKEGKAPFIHPRLYTSDMPKALQNAYAACAIYSIKTDQNAFIAWNVIESLANGLLRSPNQASWTSLDLLAAVQALLIFQFIRLFDGDISQRAQAERAEPILETWTDRLNRLTTEERSYTAETAPSWRSWIFGESVRRTSIMSLFLAGIYSLVKTGYCTLGPQISTHSFTAQRKLWDATGALEWERVKAQHDPFWTPGMDFDRVITQGSGDELDDFGMVMLITYKGRDVVDHWLALSQNGFPTVPDLHQSLLEMAQSTPHCQERRTLP